MSTNEKESDKPLVPKLNWEPARTAHIEPDPPPPRRHNECTMSDEDYARAQEDAKAGRAKPGELEDWEPMPVFEPPTSNSEEKDEQG